MSVPLSNSTVVPPPRFGLAARLVVVVALLAIETLLISGLIQSPALDDLTGAAKLTHDLQHWVFRFAIAYAGSFAILLYLRGNIAGIAAAAAAAPVRIGWLLLHVALLAPFASLSSLLYRGGALPFALLNVGWHACGLAAATALLAGMAPLRTWMDALRRTGALPFYSLVPASGAMLVFKLTQLLWAPAAALTFRLVSVVARPLIPSLRVDAATLTLITDHFAVQVSEVCSGLEGVGLMIAFCTAWLWYFRREYIFPRALIILPAAVTLIFLLNTLRIAALLIIGDAGHEDIATVGFHSQAGWIVFNAAAFGVAYTAKHSRWLNRAAPRPAPGAYDATPAYLMPLLAILAAGMITHALSAGFDFLYPLRIICAVAALWAYRSRYTGLDWSISWRGVGTGVAVFVVWAAVAHFVTTPAPMPQTLARLTGPERAAWIGCRAAAAIITVPIAEELAYRGFLMRRIVGEAFESVPLRTVHWRAVAASAVVFGLMHGSLWFPGIVTGLAYGAVAVKTGKIGESVAAHATTNTLVALQVLCLDQWQLW
ncbi:MAG TPA: exosortase E/protease, VPEID-CTERM system [Steroidobacteraceae bacterium]|nr:exosortase E/protease, VPEID-CTERM system [Steroidobacteraceae bacterium]